MKTTNLPCTVGDMLYQPFGTLIAPYLVEEIVLNTNGALIKAINVRSEDTFITTFDINLIGKSIFLSRAEAKLSQAKDCIDSIKE